MAKLMSIIDNASEEKIAAYKAAAQKILSNTQSIAKLCEWWKGFHKRNTTEYTIYELFVLRNGLKYNGYIPPKSQYIHYNVGDQVTFENEKVTITKIEADQPSLCFTFSNGKRVGKYGFAPVVDDNFNTPDGL